LTEIVLIAVEGWSENAANWNFSLLREELKDLPIKVLVPHYLDAKGRFARFRSHKRVEQYASEVEKIILIQKQENPEAKIYVLGHSLGGIIVRYLSQRNLFNEDCMILVGTPNQGINFGFFKNLILKILARICNVPVFSQLLENSNFLQILNMNGFPKKATYISGEKDNVVPRSSSDPLGIGIVVPNCNHKLFPREREKLSNSAIPIVREILEKDLENK